MKDNGIKYDAQKQYMDYNKIAYVFIPVFDGDFRGFVTINKIEKYTAKYEIDEDYQINSKDHNMLIVISLMPIIFYGE